MKDLFDIGITFDNNHPRLRKLLELYENIGANKQGRTSTFMLELLRATIVLTHATMEDFFRNLEKLKLPQGEADQLTSIPLLKSGTRTKFVLGDLVKFKGKNVTDLLTESIEDHLDNKTYNNAAQISATLKACKIPIDEKIRGILPAIDALTQRRHHIVHQADVNLSKGKGHHRYQSISKQQVINWIESVDKLCLTVFERADNEN